MVMTALMMSVTVADLTYESVQHNTHNTTLNDVNMCYCMCMCVLDVYTNKVRLLLFVSNAVDARAATDSTYIYTSTQDTRSCMCTMMS